MILHDKPDDLYCEAKGCIQPAKYIYGPECEAETGKLMYLCNNHGLQISMWKGVHAHDPVECPTHGRIGKVKDYLILKEI